MIYEETYNFMLKNNISSVEFDVCLFASASVDWDGNIRASVREIAKKVGTSTKYMKQIIKRFTSLKRGRNVFTRKIDIEGELFNFNIAKTASLGFNPATDRYCKKYKFFYTKEFRKLPINAKRLLLMGAFRMSVNKSESCAIPLTEIVATKQNNLGMPFTKTRLMEAVKAIQLSPLNTVVSIGTTTSLFTKLEEVNFDFAEGTLDEFVENHTERYLLRRKLYQAGFQSYLSDEDCIEIEKIGSYIYRSIMREHKKFKLDRGVIYDVKDELLELSRLIYNKSIEELAKGLNANKNNMELSKPKHKSAYFSKIVFDNILSESSLYFSQAENNRSILDVLRTSFNLEINQTELEFEWDEEKSSEENIARKHELANRIEKEKDEVMAPIQYKLKKYEYIGQILTNWSEVWVSSRIDGAMENVGIKVAKERILRLRSKVESKIDGILKKLESSGNMLVPVQQLKKHFIRLKETFTDRFDIVLDNNRIVEMKKVKQTSHPAQINIEDLPY